MQQAADIKKEIFFPCKAKIAYSIEGAQQKGRRGMPIGYYGFDVYYLILIVPAVLVSMWAQHRVTRAFKVYSDVPVSCGMTGAQTARYILDTNGLQHIRVEQIAGQLTDHYSPKENVIRLSADVYHRSSISAIGVAAHEAGHAVQYATDYRPIHLRNKIIPLTNFGSALSIPLIFLGFLLSIGTLVYIGIGLFSFMTIFQLITLPVEYNASNRAERILAGSGFVTQEEQYGVHKVLSAAALTYVAALLVSVMQLLRLILLAGRRRDN